MAPAFLNFSSSTFTYVHVNMVFPETPDPFSRPIGFQLVGVFYFLPKSLHGFDANLGWLLGGRLRLYAVVFAKIINIENGAVIGWIFDEFVVFIGSERVFGVLTLEIRIAKTFSVEEIYCREIKLVASPDWLDHNERLDVVIREVNEGTEARVLYTEIF